MKKNTSTVRLLTPAREAFKFAVKIAAQSKGEIHVLYILDITFPRGNPTYPHSYEALNSPRQSMTTIISMLDNRHDLLNIHKTSLVKTLTLWIPYSK